MNALLAEVSALLADGVYIGWGVFVLAIFLFLIWLLFFRGR